jgi:YVTN family beta-propeller protein
MTGQHIVQFPLDDSPESVVYSPDGRFIYVAERDNRTIPIIDVATLQVVRRLPVSGVHAPEGAST